MNYIRYKQPHPEIGCQFEQWDKKRKCMGTCGAPAVGQRGEGKRAQPLCEEHYKIAVSNETGNGKSPSLYTGVPAMHLRQSGATHVRKSEAV